MVKLKNVENILKEAKMIFQINKGDNETPEFNEYAYYIQELSKYINPKCPHEYTEWNLVYPGHEKCLQNNLCHRQYSTPRLANWSATAGPVRASRQVGE